MFALSLNLVLAYALLASVFCFTANADSATDALTQIPACGLQCIAENLSAIGCGLTDVECQCTSKNSTKILQPCLEELCTYEQTFDILRIQASLCHRPHDSQGNYIRITAYVTGIIPIIVIAMRFASRHLGGNKFWWDDWIHLASVILVIPMTILLLLNVEAGIGQHIWDLSYPRVVAVGRWTYIATILWGFELLLVKYSILCLYLRIFPNVWLKRAVFAFMAFTACFTLPLIGLATFQCTPVRAIWDLKEQGTAKCVNYIAVLRLTVVYEIFAEIVLFSLPIPIVLKLQMKASKKIQLMVFFGLGICVIAVSIARVPFLPGVVDSVDPTYTVIGTSITGFAASGVSHICAAVPTMQNLIRFCRNGFKHDTKASSTYARDGTYGSSGKRSYKSLQDSKNNSSYSGQALGAGQQRSKASSRDKSDPYRISSILDTVDDSGIVELCAVGAQSDKGRVEAPSPTIVRGTPEPEIDDAASGNPILYEEPYTKNKKIFVNK